MNESNKPLDSNLAMDYENMEVDAIKDKKKRERHLGHWHHNETYWKHVKTQEEKAKENIGEAQTKPEVLWPETFSSKGMYNWYILSFLILCHI